MLLPLAWPRGPALRLTFYCDSLGWLPWGEALRNASVHPVGPSKALSLILIQFNDQGWFQGHPSRKRPS